MLFKKALVDLSARADDSDSTGKALCEVPYLQFPRLSRETGCHHAVFTRHGGMSPPPFHTLNTSTSTGDDPSRVAENLEIARRVLGADHLRTMNQIHGGGILVLRANSLERFHQVLQGDALITDVRGLALMVKQADCQAVIFYDPEKQVIANAHCGWRGNTRNILGSVVERMASDFGCDPSRIMAAVAPSLGPCCAEFITHREIFPETFSSFMVRPNYFDLWELSCRQLTETGVKRENIEVAGLCTRCRTDLFYSYRAEGVTGRFATMAMLK